MANEAMARIAHIFTSRLETLARLMTTAETQAGELGGIETLLAARLADDMFPLPHQIVFACDQPNQFAAWCLEETFQRTDPAALGWAALKAHVAATMAYVGHAAEAAGDEALDRDKHIDLPDGMFLQLSGADYRDEWLLPNFYFHLVTAYDLLRMKGASIGKVDYMAHLVHRIQHQG